MAKRALIQVPVADLRREPKPLLPLDFSHNDLRESQLLYGERIHILEKRGEWLSVEALEQPRFSEDKGWHPYPGWIHLSEALEVETFPKTNCVIAVPWLRVGSLSLSFGTYLYRDEKGEITLPSGEKTQVSSSALRSLGKPFDRKELLKDAHLFLQTPYLWGGRGAYSEKHVTSCDCSSLINLLYRAQGILLPRDARDQYLKATPISKEDLLPGDLIYCARLKKPKHIVHVVLYANKKTFLEMQKTGTLCKKLPFSTPLSSVTALPERSFRYAISCCRLTQSLESSIHTF